MISISKDRIETLMSLCFVEGLTCGEDKEFWESVKEKEAKDYVSERVNALLEASGIAEKE